MPDPFHGVLPALITPFTDDGSVIDTGALATIVDRVIGAGVGGLVPGGSTGEFTTLRHAERRDSSRRPSRRPRVASPSWRVPAPCPHARPASSACMPRKAAPPR